MAELEVPQLSWHEHPIAGDDPAVRKVKLPTAPPNIGTDFDWQQRDFESFRNAMMTEMQQQFPERQLWTAGDMEVVIIECLAAQLDQLSDMADRAAAEGSLHSARRAESILAWLSLIGYNPLEHRSLESMNELLDLYQQKPHLMEEDRRRGTENIHQQRRTITLSDYGSVLRKHPIVLEAYSRQCWNGSWWEVQIIVLLFNNWTLDKQLDEERLSQKFKDTIKSFHKKWNIPEPRWEAVPNCREIINDTIETFRPINQSYDVLAAQPIGLEIHLKIWVENNYYHTEMKWEIEKILGAGPTGFFKPGRIKPGDNIFAGDIYQAVMSIRGVRNMEIVQFNKEGKSRLHSDNGIITIAQDELAVCGTYGKGRKYVELIGGRPG